MENFIDGDGMGKLFGTFLDYEDRENLREADEFANSCIPHMKLITFETKDEESDATAKLDPFDYIFYDP